MRYLLDTHAFIWLVEHPKKIPIKTMESIRSRKNALYLSSASLWEIAIKYGLGKLDLKAPFEDLLDDLDRTNITVLQIENEYLLKLAVLPEVHKDPFDRLLIATAIAEDLVLITADENIRKYEVSWIW